MISAPLLLSQVKNTASFALAEAPPPAARYLEVLIARQARLEEALEPYEYYELCLSAHWATAGTYVPTDVDSAIRVKLWQDGTADDVMVRMAELVVSALKWDYAPVTARLARAPSGAVLSTHEGTWFSVAVGAYSAMKGRSKSRAALVLEAMAAEAAREARILDELARTSPLELLKASALVAHNLGDLDRVIDEWQLPHDDALRRALYKAGRPGCRAYHPLFELIGELNTRFMAPENHRHFPLREPRCLRRRREFLLPVGPFFDEWGASLARLRDSGLTGEEAGGVVRALIDGWHRLKGQPVGYTRALAGMLETFPGGMEELRRFIPARDVRLLKAGPLKALCAVPKASFEAQWANHVRKRAGTALPGRGTTPAFPAS